MSHKIEMSDDAWRALLQSKGAEPVAFEVTRHAATERAFTGKYADQFAPGTYRCICCDKPLFASDAKFDAGCGWPSFDASLSPESVHTRTDRSHGMLRQEALCPDCGAHLGHLFDDGPTETGLRFCMNSASSHFIPS